MHAGVRVVGRGLDGHGLFGDGLREDAAREGEGGGGEEGEEGEKVGGVHCGWGGVGSEGRKALDEGWEIAGLFVGGMVDGIFGWEVMGI